MKTCRICNTEYENIEENFYKSPNHRCGYRSECIPCKNVANYRYYESRKRDWKRNEEERKRIEEANNVPLPIKKQEEYMNILKSWMDKFTWQDKIYNFKDYIYYE